MKKSGDSLSLKCADGFDDVEVYVGVPVQWNDNEPFVYLSHVEGPGAPVMLSYKQMGLLIDWWNKQE